jgi:hypothetical protein
MGEHAVFSPSSAHRWMRCAGSIALSQGVPDGGSSEFAAEGTAAHELAQMAFVADMPAAAFVGTEIKVEEFAFTVDDEMAGHVQTFLDQVAREHGIHECEIRVPLAAALQVEDQFGTADRVVLDTDNDTLQVHDLKFGRGVQVFAQENEQLMLYAAGAALMFDALGNWKHFKVAIHQPRLNHYDEWTFDRERMIQFIKDARRTVKKAKEALEVEDKAHLRTYLEPGEKQCRWCPAAGSCPVLAQAVHDETLAEFMDEREQKDLTGRMNNAELAEAFGKVDWVKGWVTAVMDEAHRRVMDGEELPGYKLVQGRAGARKWDDEEAVTEMLKKARIKQDVMFDFKLITPPKAEKVFKKIKPRLWPKLEDRITQSDGKLHLAPADDPRPAQSPQADVEKDFEDETGA